MSKSFHELKAYDGTSRPLCVFGVGALLINNYPQLIMALGREPDFLCDNAPEKWGKEFLGRKCISPDELSHRGAGAVVVIVARRFEAVLRQLETQGLKDIFVACFDRGYGYISGIRRVDFEEWSRDRQKPFENRVRGKWTLITGASRGIGRQIALAMAGLGSNILAHGRSLEHAREIVGSCASLGVQAIPVAAELSNPTETEAMLTRLECEAPPIDILFNNAAIGGVCGPDAWRASAQDYLTTLTVNTVAPIRICAYLIPPMLKRGFGRVVNVSSTVEKHPELMGYSCSKAALSKFVNDLAPSLKGTGVMISQVCPGHVRSDMGGPEAPAAVESVIPGVLLGATQEGDLNGRWFIAQDYAGLSLAEAARKDRFYYGGEG